MQLIDVMPTILDLLGLKIPDLVDGQSLAAFVKGEPFQRRGPVMTSRYASAHARGIVPENGTDMVALLDANWKLLPRDKATEVGLKNVVELYNRPQTLGRRRTSRVQNPQEVERMMAEISRWMDAQKQIK